MPTWTSPSLTDTYADVLSMLQDRADSQAKMFDDGVTWTSLPTGTIRWGSANHRWEEWNGSAWVNLDSVLTDVLAKSNNLSDLTSASTARTNLGLGSIAVVNSPVPIANGGTGDTTASGARTNLGLGTMATQAASAVAITGGTLSGITALQITSGNALAFVSSGTVTNANLYQNTGGDITLKTIGGDYWLYLQTNSTTRFTVRAAGLVPGATNSYDIGASGSIIRDVFADRILTGKIYNSSDIAFQISGTTYWVMGSASQEFRPNTNNSQNLGGSSYYWNTGYVTTLLADQVQSKAASTTYINYGGGVGNVQIVAANNIDFYAGGALRWYVGSTGTLNPYGAAPDYAITYGWSVDRTLSSGSDLAQLSNVVSTVIADLVTLGLFV